MIDPSRPSTGRRPSFFGRRVFYGWWIVAGTAVLGTLSGGAYIHGFTAFVLPLTEEFDVGRGTISLVFSLASIGEAIWGPILGMLIDRHGARRLMVVGITLMGLAFVLGSMAQSMLVFFLIFVPLVSIGMSMGMFAPPAASVGNWFVRRRGLAMAIAMTGFGLGGLLVPLVRYLIDAYDWRFAAAAIGVTIWIVGYPITALMRHRPEQYGMFPDGASAPPAMGPSPRTPVVGEIDFTVREALSTRAFWLLGAWFGFRMVIVASLGVHFIPIIEDAGYSAATGATLLSFFAIVTLPARLFFGYLADRLPKTLLAAGLSSLIAVAIVVLATADSLWQLYLFVAIYAVAWGGSGASMIMAIRGEYFGRRNFATIAGLGSIMIVPGTVLGPTFTGFSYDRTGSYDLAFYTFIVAALLSVVMMLLVRRPVLTQPRR